MSMLRNAPFSGDYPIALHFGDRPDLFRQINHAGLALRGHPGLDFGLPEGTSVLAVQHGVVLDVRDDDESYGKSVLVGHRWGQTFYAHLHSVDVGEGQQVGAGQQLGLSGDSGITDGPMLHFGLRVIPYSVDDGWVGFADPLPYLFRLVHGRGAIIGPHIIGGVRPHLDTLFKWQPRLITILDPSNDDMLALRDVCPESTVVARAYVPDHEVNGRIQDNPLAAAQWADEVVQDRMVHGVDYWQIANEVLQGADELPLLNEFEVARMNLADEAGYRCAIFGFSVGNPDLPEDDRMNVWENVYPALAYAEEYEHVVALHQYGMPEIWGPNNLYDWYIYRLEHQILRRLPFRRLKFAVTEYGIDGLISDDAPIGWQGFTTPEGYVEQLLKCGRYVERFSGQVLGYSIFTLGHHHPWQSYDIEGKTAAYLADLSEKGTWRDIDAQVYDIAPRDTDTDTDPGPTISEESARSNETSDRSPGSNEESQAPSEHDSTAEIRPNPDESTESDMTESYRARSVIAESELASNSVDETTDATTASTSASEWDEDPDSEGWTVAAEADEKQTSRERTEPEIAGDEPQASALQDQSEADENSTDPDESTDDSSDEDDTPQMPLVDRRIALSFAAYNMVIAPIDQRPDFPLENEHADTDVVYIVKDVFMTYFGSWELTEDYESVPEWARDDYLRREFLEAGADHHLFAAVIGLDGEFIKGQPVIYWSDGFEQLGNENYDNYVTEQTKQSSGWANMFMAGGSSFVPQRGERGPWCWAPNGAAEVIVGGGLPIGHPVSTFVVWQAVPRAEWEATLEQEPDTETEPPSEEATDSDSGEPGGGEQEERPTPTIEVERRLSEWVDHYNIEIKSLTDRPDTVSGDVRYVVRDIFTTRNGSWEPIALPGAVPQWARDDYLKPVGAPDYFDDAGGDHHLFSAVIGLDGELVEGQEIVYWSDGFDALADPEYDAYVRRHTKQGSRWANIVTGPGSSFVPERDESGPWCWAPAGASEVVCGGGLPANTHISFFVVWQAVPNTDSGNDEPEDDQDNDIYLPTTPSSDNLLSTGQEVERDPTSVTALRQAAWTRIGIEPGPDSALADYARAMGLGRPVTQEFESNGYRVQAYQNGIVYAPVGEMGRITHADW